MRPWVALVMGVPVRARDITKPAHHEAGHAVVAQILGIEPQSASVIGDETTQGRVLAAAARWTRPEIVIDGRTEMRLHREIMVCFAGVLAERRFVGRLNRIRASKDYEVAAADRDVRDDDHRGGKRAARVAADPHR